MSEPENMQRQIAESGARTIVVSGGPGSGKTRLLMERYAHLIESRGEPLSSILVLTFSSASATRLRRSIEAIMQRSYDELWIHTCHSFAGRVLADSGAAAGDSGPVSSVTPFRGYLAIKELLCSEQPHFESKLKAIALKDGLAREVSDFFGLLKQNLIRPDDFEKITRTFSPQLRDMALMYSACEKYMGEKGWLGLRDAVARVVEMFEADAEMLSEYRQKFSHILVDEFQEIDCAQFRLIRLLASDQSSLFVTGDEDQRIYRFRGSGTGQFEEITKGREDAQVCRLEKNYRLPPELRKASQNLIAHNRDAKAESSPVAFNGEVRLAEYRDAIEQAYAIARDIKREVLDGADSSHSICYSDFTVICRSTSRSAVAFEEAFSYYDVPYVLYNSTSFYKHPMVRCVADFIRLLVDPGDDGALLRVLNAPTFGLDAVELSRLANQENPAGTGGFYEAIRQAATDGGSSESLNLGSVQTAEALGEFVRFFEDIRRQALDTDCPSSLVHSVMNRLFFGGVITDKDVSAGVRDAQNLRLLYEVVADIEGVLGKMRGRCTLSDVADYMEHAFAHFSSEQENDPADESADGIRLMTVHQAKGMEFPFVFLVDMTEDSFPTLSRGTCLLDGKSLGQLTAGIERYRKEQNRTACSLQFMMTSEDQLKEERRLAYVAITRASRRLTICLTDESHLAEPVQPSPFIEELLGAPLEAAMQKRGDSAGPLDSLDLLGSALNNQELESALRTCVRRLRPDAKATASLLAFLESLGLDSRFICEELPFEGEPQKAPDLAGHRYSASQLKTYLTCPRQFFFEKILRIAPERPEDFGLGQLIHIVLEKFHEEVKKFGGDPKALEANLAGVFLAVWQGHPKADARSRKDAFCNQYPTALQRAAIERRAADILRRYIRTETVRAPDKEIVACEKSVDFRVGDYPFVARMDRIDAASEGHQIIDYKTSASGPKGARTIKKNFLNLDGKPDYAPQDFQLPLYLLAARSAGYDPVELVYYWLAQEDASGMFKKSSLCVGEGDPDFLSAEDTRVVEESVLGIVNRIASGEFDPRPQSSFDCRWCSFDFVCSAEEEDIRQNDR